MTWFESLVRGEDDSAPGAQCRTPGEGSRCSVLSEEFARLRRDAEDRVGAARSAARREVEATEHEVRLTIDGLLAARRGLLTMVETELAHLARTMAERILREELVGDPGRHARMVRAAIQDLGSASTVDIACHPDRVALLVATTQEASSPLRIRPDATLAAWDFELRTDLGSLDGRLDSQLRELEAAFAREPLALEAACAAGAGESGETQECQSVDAVPELSETLA